MIVRLMGEIEAWSSKAASLDVDSPQSRNHFDRTLLFEHIFRNNFSIFLSKEIVCYILRNEARHQAFTLPHQRGLASPHCRTSCALHPTTHRLTTDQTPIGGNRQQKS